ncbi:hypothetical protein M3Y99_01732000 [Aphelenchoides fujianensis]|nr:hypothetical protein M3Y99_01732000 [Aphelenchoides fujianensis]
MNQHDFNNALIELVREEQVLYCSSDLNFTNSGERHLAYERIAVKLREHGASYEQTHRLNEKFLKLKWRWMKERTAGGGGQTSTLLALLSSAQLPPAVGHRIREVGEKRMNASVPEDGQSRDEQQYVDVQTLDVPTGSGMPKVRNGQKRKIISNYMEDETDNRLMEKRRVTNLAFSEFVACKLDEFPEPIRTATERQIIDLVMSVHVETYAELLQNNQSAVMHATGPRPPDRRRSLPPRASGGALRQQRPPRPAAIPAPPGQQARMPAKKKAAAAKRGGRPKKGAVQKKAAAAPAAAAAPPARERSRSGSHDSAVVEQEMLEQKERVRAAPHPDDEHLLDTELENSTAGDDAAAEEGQKIAELQQELQKAERSKQVLYKALVRERNLHNDKPSIVAMASKSGHNMTKAYSQLSDDQKQDRLRLLASIISEFADPKGTSKNKTGEVKTVLDALAGHLKDSPRDFE